MINIICNASFYCRLSKFGLFSFSEYPGWKETIDSFSRESFTNNFTSHPSSAVDITYQPSFMAGNTLRKAAWRDKISRAQPFPILQNSQSNKIGHEVHSKILHQRLLPFLNLEDNNRFHVFKFVRNLNVKLKIKNSNKFAETIACILTEEQHKSLNALLHKYIQEGGFIQGVTTKVTKKEKELFRNMRKLLIKSIEDRSSAEQLMKLFATCNPKFISLEKIKKIRQFNYQQYQSLQEKPNKFQVALASPQIGNWSQKLLDQQIANDNKNDYLSQLISQKKAPLSFVQLSKLVKLKLKKQGEQSKLSADEKSLEEVSKKMFKNLKVVSDPIVFRVVDSKESEQHERYADKLVYAYDLPYNLSEDDGEQICSLINKSYGKVVNFSIHPYCQIAELASQEVKFQIPEGYLLESTKKRVKLQKTITEASSSIVVPDRKQKMNLTAKILQKMKKNKSMFLNKSTIIFEFQDIEDKLKFLTPEMRLYGLNFGKFRNIKFEEAQSKHTIVLSMLPWGCQSDDLVAEINSLLEPLGVSIDYPNCIIAKNYVFIKLRNFYEAMSGRRLLNNAIFQKQHLKAQIIYGSSMIHQGQYKSDLDLEHYDTLVSKMQQLRNFYNQIHH